MKRARQQKQPLGRQVLAGITLAEDLAAAIGAESARQLMAAFSGGELYVPTSAGPNHPITVAIGAEKAALLCEYYGTVRIDFPLSATKRRRALDLHAAGVPNRAIARELWLTDRHVRRILADAGEDTRNQLRLFG